MNTNSMKNMTWFLIAGILGAVQITLAQVRFAAETYESDPEKYLGQRVTILVDSVSVPAINATSEDDEFRLFSVSTKGQRQGEYVWGGSIYVKVPKNDAAAFVKRHNSSTAKVPKNVSGTFLKGDAKEKYIYDSFYIDCTR